MGSNVNVHVLKFKIHLDNIYMNAGPRCQIWFVIHLTILTYKKIIHEKTQIMPPESLKKWRTQFNFWHIACLADQLVQYR